MRIPSSLTCRRCGVDAPLDMFSKHKGCLHGRDRSRCKKCVSEIGKASRANKEFTTKKAAYDAQRFQDNKEAIYEYRKTAPHEIAYSRQWSRTRKQSVKDRTPIWSDTKAIRDIYLTCAEMTLSTGIPYEVDHVIPLHGKNVSGFHVEGNLAIISREDNASKSNVYLDWY